MKHAMVRMALLGPSMAVLLAAASANASSITDFDASFIAPATERPVFKVNTSNPNHIVGFQDCAFDGSGFCGSNLVGITISWGIEGGPLSPLPTDFGQIDIDMIPSPFGGYSGHFTILSFEVTTDFLGDSNGNWAGTLESDRPEFNSGPNDVEGRFSNPIVVQAVPEPSSLALLAVCVCLGLVAIFAKPWRVSSA